MSQKVASNITVPDAQAQKVLLWKKYLSKKKSFAKAQLRLDEFERLDEQVFERWLAGFSGDKAVMAFFNREEIWRRQEHWNCFAELCRMRRISPAAMAFQIQKLCIEQNRFFWGVVRNLHQTAQEEARERYRRALKDILDKMDAGQDAPPESVKEMFENFQDFCRSSGEATSPSAKQSPEPPESQEETKKLYRILCFRHHPDRTGIYNEALWTEIRKAYEHDDLKKLRELLEIPIPRELNNPGEFSREEIQAMTAALEKRFKPVRAGLKRAKRTMYWNFHNWDELRKELVKKSMLRQMDEEITRQNSRLAELRNEYLRIFQDEPVTILRKRKNVSIIVSAEFETKAYRIQLSYFAHRKELVGTLSSESIENFAETCVLMALQALKAPCRVTLSLPKTLFDALPPPHHGCIFSSDYQNQFSRHIVEFKPAEK